jgi:FKBP-type peptidyl-prolyl cis-trans isomerase
MSTRGVIFMDTVIGTGAPAQVQSTVTVHYAGRLHSTGALFDKSKKSKPFSFVLGAGEVIKGWDVGVCGMKVGGKRMLTIPPNMAYGKRGAEPIIPPHATLLFEIHVINVT